MWLLDRIKNKILLQSPKTLLIGILVFADFLIIILLVFTTKFTQIQDPQLSNPQQEALRVFKICQTIPSTEGGKQYIDCVAQEFVGIIQKGGFVFMNQSFLDFQNIDSKSRSCHVIAHRISQYLTRDYSKNWKEVLAEIDPGMCGGGFMHGVLEVRIGEDSLFEINTDTFEEICNGIYSEQFATTCAHILGHIILIEKEADLEGSLAVCDGLTGEFLFECYGGIFMEDSFRTNFVDHELGEEPIRNQQWFEDQLARCRRYRANEMLEAGCFYDLAEVIAQTHNYNPQKTYELCFTADWKESRERCYVRASYIIAITPLSQIDTMDFKELCSFYPEMDNVQKKCIQHTVGALMQNSLLFVNRASKFCSGVKEENTVECFQQVGGYIRNKLPTLAERNNLCLAIPQEYRQFCLEE